MICVSVNIKQLSIPKSLDDRTYKVSHWIQEGERMHNRFARKKQKILFVYYRLRENHFHWVRHMKPAMKAVGNMPAIISITTIRKSFFYITRHGLRKFINKTKEHMLFDALYQKWLRKNVEEPQERTNIRNMMEPKISIIVPVYNTKKKHLISMIESVKSQTYPHWELCIADGNSKEAYIKAILSKYFLDDQRIKVMFLDQNEGIAGNSNEAIALSSGNYITFLDHDDMLPKYALFEVVGAINENPQADLFYSDEDKITDDGSMRLEPHFKPDWSPDTLRSYNYIAHLTVIRRELLNRIGWFRTGFDGSQDYDLILRATEQTQNVVHIPKILYHWRIIGGSTSADPLEKPYTHISGRKSLEDHLKRLQIEGKIEDGIFPNSYRVKYELKSSPLVSIIIPNRDNPMELSACVRSIEEKSTYRNYEIIIMENGSVEMQTFDIYSGFRGVDNIRIFTWNKPQFNYSQINNDAINLARGEIVLFLNNDIKVISPDWIESMLQHAICENVGCVGAKLYYENNTVQHAGIVIGLCGIAGHPFRGFSRGSHGHKGRLNVIQNVSAVTGACLMMRKSVFNEVGGFDERYPLAFNDVDLCMKIRQRDYLVVYTPYSELYHCESKSRGYENTSEKLKRFEMEAQLFREKWSAELQKGDPYYNKNLTLKREDYTPDV